MKKMGNLIELNGKVFCIREKKEIEQNPHSMEYSVIFFELPEVDYTRITPGKVYDIRQVVCDDDGDIFWFTIWTDDGDGLSEEYHDIDGDSFVIVSQVYDDRHDTLEFMIYNRLSEVDLLTKEIKETRNCEHRELVELTIENLKAQIELLEKRLEKVQALQDHTENAKTAKKIAEAWLQCGNINAYRMDTNGSFIVYQYRYTNGEREEERVEYTTPCKYDMLSFLIKVYLIVNKMDFDDNERKQALNADIKKTIKIIDRVEWTRWR